MGQKIEWRTNQFAEQKLKLGYDVFDPKWRGQKFGTIEPFAAAGIKHWSEWKNLIKTYVTPTSYQNAQIFTKNLTILFWGLFYFNYELLF